MRIPRPPPLHSGTFAASANGNAAISSTPEQIIHNNTNDISIKNSGDELQEDYSPDEPPIRSQTTVAATTQDKSLMATIGSVSDAEYTLSGHSDANSSSAFPDEAPSQNSMSHSSTNLTQTAVETSTQIKPPPLDHIYKQIQPTIAVQSSPAITSSKSAIRKETRSSEELDSDTHEAFRDRPKRVSTTSSRSTRSRDVSSVYSSIGSDIEAPLPSAPKPRIAHTFNKNPQSSVPNVVIPPSNGHNGTAKNNFVHATSPKGSVAERYAAAVAKQNGNSPVADETAVKKRMHRRTQSNLDVIRGTFERKSGRTVSGSSARSIQGSPRKIPLKKHVPSNIENKSSISSIPHALNFQAKSSKASNRTFYKSLSIVHNAHHTIDQHLPLNQNVQLDVTKQQHVGAMAQNAVDPWVENVNQDLPYSMKWLVSCLHQVESLIEQVIHVHEQTMLLTDALHTASSDVTEQNGAIPTVDIHPSKSPNRVLKEQTLTDKDTTVDLARQTKLQELELYQLQRSVQSMRSTILNVASSDDTPYKEATTQTEQDHTVDPRNTVVLKLTRKLRATQKELAQVLRERCETSGIAKPSDTQPDLMSLTAATGKPPQLTSKIASGTKRSGSHEIVNYNNTHHVADEKKLNETDHQITQLNKDDSGNQQRAIQYAIAALKRHGSPLQSYHKDAIPKGESSTSSVQALTHLLRNALTERKGKPSNDRSGKNKSISSNTVREGKLAHQNRELTGTTTGRRRRSPSHRPKLFSPLQSLSKDATENHSSQKHLSSSSKSSRPNQKLSSQGSSTRRRKTSNTAKLFSADMSQDVRSSNMESKYVDPVVQALYLGKPSTVARNRGKTRNYKSKPRSADRNTLIQTKERYSGAKAIGTSLWKSKDAIEEYGSSKPQQSYLDMHRTDHGTDRGNHSISYEANGPEQAVAVEIDERDETSVIDFHSGSEDDHQSYSSSDESIDIADLVLYAHDNCRQKV